VMSQKRPHIIPSVIAVLMLLGALGEWPYGYYKFLRWITCAVALFVAFMAYDWHKLWATWLFGFIALLFNPLIPVHLSRQLWQPIDLICAVLFVLSVFILRKPVKNKQGVKQED